MKSVKPKTMSSTKKQNKSSELYYAASPIVRATPHKFCLAILNNKLTKLYISHIEHYEPVGDFADEEGLNYYACWQEPIDPMSLVGTTRLQIPMQTVLLPDNEQVIIPVKASKALLHSMAVRYDHSLGISEGMTDDEIIAMRKSSPIMACMYRTSQEREGLMTTMKQLHEEVVGRGFYNYEKDTH